MPKTGMMLTETVAPVIDLQRCSGCGRCVSACPERLFTLETVHHRKTARILAPYRCTSCGACVTACPLQVVALAILP